MAAKQAFVDKEASRYNLTGTATLKPEFSGGSPGGGFPGGGRRGGRSGGGFPGGGFPGGGFPGGGRRPGGGYPGGDGGPGRAGRRMPVIEIAGEYWIAAAPSIKTKTKNSLLPSIVQTVPSGPFVRLLDDKVAKTKGLPVSSKVTMTMKSPRAEAPTMVTVTTAVTSMKEDPLADALFQVPLDYRSGRPATGLRPAGSDGRRPLRSRAVTGNRARSTHLRRCGGWGVGSPMLASSPTTPPACLALNFSKHCPVSF